MGAANRLGEGGGCAQQLVRRLVSPPGGGDDLDPDTLKAFKQFARKTDGHLLLVAQQLWKRLGAPSSQTRFYALRACAELWQRSSAFRHELLGRLHEFVPSVVGTAERALPGPPAWAERLHALALELLRRWHESHGALEGYRPLALALRHLRVSGR